MVTLTEEMLNGKLHFLCGVCSKRDSNAGFSCKFCENFESTFLTELKQSYNKVPSRKQSTKYVVDLVLVSLSLALNRFHTLF